MKHTMTRAAAITAAACLSTAALTACDISSVDSGSSDMSTGSSTGSDSSHTHKNKKCGENLDYTEVPVNEDLFGTDGSPTVLQVADGAVQIRAVYFQPGQMMAGSKMLSYDASAAHLEVDTKMTEKGAKLYGYAAGETPSHLHIEYKIRKKGSTDSILAGTLMEMNAGDGSHYGINLPAGKMMDGDYQIQFIVKPPTLAEYPLHKDNVTGVNANNWWQAEPTEWIDWAYKTPKKHKNPVENCDVPAYQPVASQVIPAPESAWKKSATMKKDANGLDFGCEEPEIDIADINAAPFKIGMAYFQPGGMLEQWLTGKSAMNAYQDSLAHLEADIHVVDDLSKGVIGDKGSDYGYKSANSDGLEEDAPDAKRPETPANLDIHYEILTKDGKTIDKGMFMEMNAGDGSHYGTNLNKDVPLVDGTEYKIRLSIAPPKNYSLHVDRWTGVKVRHWFKPFTVETDWHYTGNQKHCIVKDPNWGQAFPQPVPALEK